MHSRILGIISKKDVQWAKEEGRELELPLWSFEENIPYFADYVGKTDDFKEDFNWFIEYLLGITKKFITNKKEYSIKILPGFKEEYFKDRFKKAKEFFDNPNAFKIFCGVPLEGENKYNAESRLYDLKSFIEEKYGFYASDIEGTWETIDSFIRTMDENEEYIIFDSIDYHY